MQVDPDHQERPDPAKGVGMFLPSNAVHHVPAGIGERRTRALLRTASVRPFPEPRNHSRGVRHEAFGSGYACLVAGIFGRSTIYGITCRPPVSKVEFSKIGL